MLTAACLVLLMTPGLSFFYGGMVQPPQRALHDAAEFHRHGR
jgi:ammonia channel protein AmtB